MVAKSLRTKQMGLAGIGCCAKMCQNYCKEPFLLVFILARRFLGSSELGQLLPRKREASSHAASHSTGNHLAEIITAKVERSTNVNKIGTEHDNHGNNLCVVC